MDIDINVNKSVTPGHIKNVFDFINKLLLIGKPLAKITRTEVDDQALATIELIVKTIQPFAEQEGFVDIINLLISFFKSEPDPRKRLALVNKLFEQPE